MLVCECRAFVPISAGNNVGLSVPVHVQDTRRFITFRTNLYFCKTDRAGRTFLRQGFPGIAIAKKGKCRSEEHTSELQSLMRISYAVFCLKKKKEKKKKNESKNTIIQNIIM